MSHHYTRNTLEDTKYCNTCNRRTQHAVRNGRIGHCLEHSTAAITKKQELQQKRITQRKQQPTLF